LLLTISSAPWYVRWVLATRTPQQRIILTKYALMARRLLRTACLKPLLGRRLIGFYESMAK